MASSQPDIPACTFSSGTLDAAGTVRGTRFRRCADTLPGVGDGAVQVVGEIGPSHRAAVFGRVMQKCSAGGRCRPFIRQPCVAR